MVTIKNIWKITKRLVFPAASFLIPLFIYLKTLLPSVDFSDIGELQAVAASLGIAHPTGYPLYTLLGYLSTKIAPFGNAAWRVNFLSALASAAAALLTFRLINKLTHSPRSALITSLTLSFIPGIWKSSLIAEPYSLTWFSLGLLANLLVDFWQTKNTKTLLLFSFLYGLACGGHSGIIILIPAFVVFLLTIGFLPWRYPKQTAAAAFLFLLGLSIYLYIPLRSLQNPPLNYGRPTTADRFVYHITGGQFRWLMFSVGPKDFIARRLPDYLRLLSQQLPLPAFAVFTLSGLLYFIECRQKLPFLFFVLAGLSLSIFVWLEYDVPDFWRYITPAFWFSGWLSAFGISWIEQRLPQNRSFITLALLLVPLWLIIRNWKTVDQSKNLSADSAGRKIMSQVEPNAVIVSWWPYSAVLWYLEYGENIRKDVLVVDDQTMIDNGWKSYSDVFNFFIGKRPAYLLPEGTRVERTTKEFSVEKVSDDLFMVFSRLN